MEKWQGLETTVLKTLCEYVSLDIAAFEAWVDSNDYEDGYKKVLKECVKYFNKAT